MINIIKIFLVIVILGGAVLYFFSNPPSFFRSSPNKGNSVFKNFFSPSQTPTSLPSKTIQPSSPPSYGNYSISSPVPTIPDSQIPAGFVREDLSPYFKKIKASSVSVYSNSKGDYSVTLRINYSVKDEAVDITGWKIKSNKGEIFIPQAVNVYEPNGLNNESDIVLSGNGYVNIYKGKSPINRNFRLNRCTGYLQKTYNFSPPLSLNCPRVDRGEIINLSGQCQSYIMSLSSCALPNLNFYNSLPGTDQGNECRAFLSGITPNSCFQKHQGDADFLSSEWRLWMDFNNNVFDRQHDRILIFDNSGLLVSQYIY